jgi:hypothetical protein
LRRPENPTHRKVRDGWGTRQRRDWKIAGGYGIHWPDIDEDLSTEGLLRGATAPKASVNAK